MSQKTLNRLSGISLWLIIMGILSLWDSLGLIIFVNGMIAASYIIGWVDRLIEGKK